MALFLSSCGQHSFFDDVFDDLFASSSSEGLEGVSSSSGVISRSSSSIILPGTVGPLLKTRWGQGPNRPENKWLYTEDGEYFGDSAGVCAAIAWAQIMAYHKYPARGFEESGPFKGFNEVQVPSVNFNVAYDWDNMLDYYGGSGYTYTERQVNAVATLVLHNFVLVYTTAAGLQLGNRMPGRLINNFGYDKSVRIYQLDYYTDAEWDAIIKEQLATGLPVYMQGDPDAGEGHAFVVDGYNNEGKFSFNMGWGGGSSWSFLRDIPFKNNQLIVANIKPAEGGSLPIYELQLNSFSFTKNSVNYNNNTEEMRISHNEPFVVKAAIRYIDDVQLAIKEVGAALVDNNDRISEVICSIKNPINISTSGEIDCLVPETVSTGRHKLMVVAKAEGGEWKTITRSRIRRGVLNSISFEVR